MAGLGVQEPESASHSLHLRLVWQLVGSQSWSGLVGSARRSCFPDLICQSDGPDIRESFIFSSGLDSSSEFSYIINLKIYELDIDFGDPYPIRIINIL